MLHEFREGRARDRFGTMITANPIDGNVITYDKSYFAQHPPYLCPLAASLVNYEVVSELYDLALMVGAKAYESDVSEHKVYGGFLFQTPEAVANYFGAYSGRAVLLRNIDSLFRGRWDKFTDTFGCASIAGENPCVHENLFGYVSSARWNGVNGSYSGAGHPRYQVLKLTSFESPYVEFSLEGIKPSGPVLSLDLAHADSTFGGTYQGGYTRRYPLVYLSGSAFGDLQIEYHYGIQLDNQLLNRRDINWFTVRISYGFNPENVPLEVDQEVSLQELSNAFIHIEWVPRVFSWSTPIGNPDWPDIDQLYEGWQHMFPSNVSEDWSGDDYWCLSSAVQQTSLSTVYNHGSIAQLIGFSESEQRYTTLDSKSFQGFCHEADIIVSESINAMALPYAKALDAQFSALKANHLETLAEIADMAAPVDLVKMAGILPSRVRSKGALVVGILDLLADAYLVTKFGLAPTLSDAEDVSKKAKALWHRITSGEAFEAQTTYGKEVVVFEEGNSMGITPGTVVELRTKIRAKQHPDSLLTALITADSLGILPSLSNFWDIVPWSFLVDWFFPVGDLLSIVDDQAKILAVDCTFCVHSIKVCRYFTSELLAPYGYGIDYESDESGAGYRKFVRLIDDSAPIFGPTRLPVTNQPGIPDYWLAGSLAYKQIK